MDWHENAAIFNDKELEQYKVVIFLNTTGNILDDTQQAAFEKFIKSGYVSVFKNLTSLFSSVHVDPLSISDLINFYLDKK